MSRIIVWSLSSTARRNRQQLLEASAEQQSAQSSSRSVDGDMVSVYIGSQSMQPTVEIDSGAVSLSLEGSSSADRLAAPAPVSESAERPLCGVRDLARHTADGCCAYSHGARPGSGSMCRRSSLTGESAPKRNAAESSAYGEESNIRLGGAGCHMATRGACTASVQAATAAREGDGLEGEEGAAIHAGGI